MSPSQLVAVWVTQPSALQRVDLSDGASLFEHTYLTDGTLDMSDSGWVKLGTARITYDNLASREEAVPAMCSQIDEAIEKLRATAEQKVSALLAEKQNLLALGYASND